MDATAPPGPPQSRPHSSRRRLRRDRNRRVLGGVAAGVARSLGLDVTLVRVLWVIAAFFWIGIPAYVVLWLALPADDGTSILGDTDRPRDLGLIAGLALIGIGVLVAARHLVPHWGGSVGGPLLLIAGGVAILILRRPSADDHEDTVDEAPLGPDATPTDQITVVDATGETSTADTPPTAWTQTAPWGAPPRERDRPRRRRERSFLTPLTISVLLIGAGVTSFLVAIEAVTLNLTVAFAIATGIVGLALIVSAFAGRARLLIPLGILLAGMTAVTSVVDVPLHGGIGNREYTPQSISELRSYYELGIGDLQLDLSQIPATEWNGPDRTIEVHVGIGELRVIAPVASEVDAEGHAGAGRVSLFRHDDAGTDVNITATNNIPGLNRASTTVLHLRLRVGAGRVMVTQ